MTNPLGIGAAPVNARTPFADMAVGETRTCVFPGNKTQSGSITITRTKRPFAFDWVDAVNEQFPKRGFVWVVDRNDEPKLVGA